MAHKPGQLWRSPQRQYNHGMLQAATAWLSVLIAIAAATGVFVVLALRTLTRPARTVAGGTPPDYGLPYESVSFSTPDAITLKGWWIPAIVPRATLVFCHGYAGSKAPDLKYVPALREHGYSVLLFDFRAHGESAGTRTSLVCNERQDLLAAIAFLQQHGIHQVGLIGFSMGAAVAIATAPLSTAVSAVVADSAFAELRTIVAQNLRRRGCPSPIATLWTALILQVASRYFGCNVFHSDPIRWVGRVSPRPLLIIHGGRDRDVPVSEAIRLYELAGLPKELWVVDEAEHRCADQVRPEEYMPRILAFFDAWL